MQCWQCGADVQPGERTCSYCGARLTSPPSGRAQRSSQQRNPSRRPRDDEWESDAQGASGYADGYGSDDESAYGSAYPRDDRRGGRRGARSSGDEGRNDARPDWRGQQRGRSRAGQEPDALGGGQPQNEYDQSGDYEDDYASQEYDAHQPDPFDDPRAPRNLRSNPRSKPDAGGGYPPGPPSDATSRYPRDDRQQQMPPDIGPRRPPTDPSRDRRRDASGYRGRGAYGPDGAMPPQGMAPDQYSDQYEEPGRSRRGTPSSADIRYGRSSASRGQSSSYDDRYSGEGYGDGYSDEYSGRQAAPRQNYGRRGPPDEPSSWYQQVGTRAREVQQRWGETFNSLRIPGLRPQEETSEGKSSSRRVVTTIVLLLVLVGAVVAGVIAVGPRVLEKLHPSATTSSLCVPSGAATDGAPPTPDTHFKQFSSSRSRYGVNYPETWTVEPQQKIASGYDYIDVYTLPNSSSSVSIEQAQAACALSDVNIIQGEVAAAQQQSITFTEVTSAATTQTIGGEQWQRREYDVSAKGVTLHMVILACHHQGRAYVIVLVSKSTTFNQDNTGIFTPMLKSFAFTK